MTDTPRIPVEKWEDRYFEESRRSAERIESSIGRVEDKIDMVRNDVTRVQVQSDTLREKIESLEGESRELRKSVLEGDARLQAEMHQGFFERDARITEIGREVSAVTGKAAGAGAAAGMLITFIAFLYKMLTGKP